LGEEKARKTVETDKRPSTASLKETEHSARVAKL
jgi:hypothetical protein